MREFDRYSEKMETRKLLKHNLRYAAPIFIIASQLPQLLRNFTRYSVSGYNTTQVDHTQNLFANIVDARSYWPVVDDSIPVTVRVFIVACLFISLLLAAVLLVGSCYANLRYARGEEKLKILNVFKGFSGSYFVKSITLSIYLVVKVLLWTLLLVVPGIIAAIRYSQSYFILIDNPDMKVSDIVKKSSKMMEGRKGEYFVAMLSFIPWIALGVITFGILLVIFVMPYINLFLARYYAFVSATASEITEDAVVTEVKPLDEA